MKKILLQLFLGAFVISATAQINNGGFENWNTMMLFQHPAVHSGTSSSNYNTFFDNGLLNVYETQGDGSSAIHIENIAGTNEVQPGYFIFGKEPQGNGIFEGGFSVSDSAVTGISMDMKYDMADESEGFVLVQFKNQGEPVGEGNYGLGTYFFPISGSQDWGNVQFNFDAPLGVIPTHCVIAIASGDLMNSDSPFALGSFVEVDNIKFLNSTDEIQGGDFENWIHVDPISVPADCYVDVDPFNVNYAKSINEYEGSFAMRLFSAFRENNVEVGYLLMGDRAENAIIPTIHIEDETVLSFHYQYSGVDDYGEVQATFYQQVGENFIPVFEKKINLEANDEYALVEYNFLEDLEANAATANSMTLEFKSSSQSGGNIPQDGSTLLIDAVTLGGTTGFSSSFKSPHVKGIQAYPNPTIGRVVFRFDRNRAGYYRVFNSIGTQIDIREFGSNRELVYDLAGKPAGKYIFQFHTNAGVQMVRVMKL